MNWKIYSELHPSVSPKLRGFEIIRALTEGDPSAAEKSAQRLLTCPPSVFGGGKETSTQPYPGVSALSLPHAPISSPRKLSDKWPSRLRKASEWYSSSGIAIRRMQTCDDHSNAQGGLGAFRGSHRLSSMLTQESEKAR